MREQHNYPQNTRVFMFLILLLTMGCGQDREVNKTHHIVKSKKAPVVAQTIKRTEMIETLTSIGTARALKSVSVFSESSGRVTTVEIEANAKVESGQLLLGLDDQEEKLAVRLAEVRLADAQRLVNRYTTVNSRNMNIPQTQIDDAFASMKASSILLEQAQVALARKQISAPFTGHVGITELDVGDRIDPNTMVTTIDDRSVLLVNFSIPEIYVARVTPGTEVQVRLWDAADTPVRGEIVAIDSRIDVNSRSFIARAKIDNKPDRYRPGMAFEISLNASRGKFLSIPDVAMQWGSDGAYIWVDDDGKADKRDINLIKRLRGSLLIEGNVKEGDTVIVEGLQALRIGTRIKRLDSADLSFNSQKTQNIHE